MGCTGITGGYNRIRRDESSFESCFTWKAIEPSRLRHSTSVDFADGRGAQWLTQLSHLPMITVETQTVSFSSKIMRDLRR
jgi:hypothetical protein